jgi:beta-glucanase (GH16 family)
MKFVWTAMGECMDASDLPGLGSRYKLCTDQPRNHEFEWTTTSANNSFVQDGILYIVPTLTSDSLGSGAITNGYILNLTADGTCTSTNVSQCAVVSNSSTGSIINPVQSARLITRDKVSVKYGKVEVTARMPLG